MPSEGEISISNRWATVMCQFFFCIDLTYVYWGGPIRVGITLMGKGLGYVVCFLIDLEPAFTE